MRAFRPRSLARKENILRQNPIKGHPQVVIFIAMKQTSSCKAGQNALGCNALVFSRVETSWPAKLCSGQAKRRKRDKLVYYGNTVIYCKSYVAKRVQKLTLRHLPDTSL
jgi:hypothetical protein